MMDFLLILLEVVKNLTVKILVEHFNKLKNLLKIYLISIIRIANHPLEKLTNLSKITTLLTTLISKSSLNK
jgi:predicted glycosyltransferase